MFERIRERLVVRFTPPQPPVPDPRLDTLARLRREHAQLAQQVKASREWQRMCYLEGAIDLIEQLLRSDVEQQPDNGRVEKVQGVGDVADAE